MNKQSLMLGLATATMVLAALPSGVFAQTDTQPKDAGLDKRLDGITIRPEVSTITVAVVAMI